MPSIKKFHKDRLERSRSVLLSHPALEAPDDTVLPPSSPLAPVALDHLLARATVSYNVNPSALCDTNLLRQVGAIVKPTLSRLPAQWTVGVPFGTMPSDLSNAAALNLIIRPPLAHPPIVPGAESVEAAHAQFVRLSREKAAAARKAARAAAAAAAAATAVASQRTGTASASASASATVPRMDASSSTVKTRSVTKRGSASECCFCPDTRFFNDVEMESELVGPFVNARGRATLRVHFECALWAPQVFADPRSGEFKRVYDEYLRGRHLRCVGCGGKGATVGCYVERCKKVFHYRCLQIAGARRVNEFYVAFCSNHQHLADKDAYKLMMHASLVADVASAHRETTDGLDTPHSKYTQLRRRDTELIFSRRARVCSHNAVHDNQKVLFSSRKRRLLGSTDPLRIVDRVRLVRTSAIPIATGALALLSIGKSNPDEAADICPSQARAAIASRLQTGLLLLRNLEKAPNWTPADIRVVKYSAKRTQTTSNKRKRGSQKRAQAVDLPADVELVSTFDGAASDFPQIIPSEVNGTRDQSPRYASKDQAVQAKAGKSSLPSSREKNNLKRPRPGGKNRPKKSAKISPGEAGLDSPALASGAAESARGNGVHLSAQEQTSHVMPTLQRGPSTGWGEFLKERLPKERAVRPEDTMEVALSNMACLWSLLSSSDRGKYEARAASINSNPDLLIPLTDQGAVSGATSNQ